MPKNASSKPKKEFKLKPCNDPTRDDWAVLSKLLGRTVSPEGMTEEQAKASLSGLLVEAYARSCDQLVTAACHSRASMASGKKSYLMTIFDALGRNPARRLDFYETIRTRLLMPEDGRDRPVAKANQDKGKGSSYRMLDYWEPDKMGILPYIRVRVTHIINGMKEEIKERNQMVSFSTLDATNTGLQIDSDGMGRVVRQQSHHDMADDADMQELHDAGLEVGENARIASPEDALDGAVEGIEGAEGGARSGADRSVLPSTHKGVVMLNRMLDSILSDEPVNNSPLFDKAFVEALADNNVTLGAFKDLKNLMADPGKKESSDELDARISAEMVVAREMVEVLGGMSRLPDDTGVRMAEAVREFTPEAEAPEEVDLGDEEAAVKAVSEVFGTGSGAQGSQRFAYALSQNRKQLTAFAKPNRPEFDLFGLVLGEQVTPSESPEARYTQLRELAVRVAKEKCQGMNDPDEPERIEDAVAEWDPSQSSFGRQFPDVLDHIESEVTREFERKAAAALEAAKAAAEAKKLAAEAAKAPPLKTQVDEDGQFDFLRTLVVQKGTPARAVAALRDAACEEADQRSLAGVTRDAKTVEEIIRDPAIQEAFAVRNALETGFWTSICSDPEQLDSPERVDYRFLCSKFGIEPDPDLTGEDLHRTVKAMAVAWTEKVTRARAEAGRVAKRVNIAQGDKLSVEDAFNRDLLAAANAYNPAEDGFFSQALNEFFREQVAMDAERRKRGPRTKANPEEDTSITQVAAPAVPEAKEAAHVGGEKSAELF